jgi:hypothetical protein
MENAESTSNIGKSIFFLMTSILAIGGLIFLMIEAFHSNNVQEAIIALIFISMIIAGLILAIATQNFNILDFGSFGAASLSFVFGAIIWLFIGKFGAGSVLSVSQNALFSQISSQLPLNLEFVLQTFVIPFAEEMFWMVAIPVVLISICILIGKNQKAWYTKIFGQAWFQILLVSIIAGITFAIFHVGKYIISFIIAAILFRVILTSAVFASKDYGLLAKIGALVVSFSFGAHVGNNWASFGFTDGLNLMFQNFSSIGWIVLGFLALIIGGAIYQIYTIIKTGRGVPG